MLICPHCSINLVKEQRQYRCSNNHCFDIGKHGDINLLLPQQKRSKEPGDSKAMVAARRDFLCSGVYQPIAELLAKTVTIVSSGEPCVIADAGCGEGYYLRNIQRLAFPNTDFFQKHGGKLIGWDISKFAVQAAAKQLSKDASQQHSQFITATNAAIPIADNSIDILLSCFGFEVAQEFSRVVLSGGFIVTIDAGENHLIELRSIIYPKLKQYQPKQFLSAPNIDFIKEESLSYNVEVGLHQLSQLMLMTPHFFRATKAAKEKVQLLDKISISINVILRIYKIN
ncbi:MAG: methyltransferase domain-containing protein [Gammaproteobacteria bacterium]|nr:methyltransferase domain-containing protein [Gammaproteobacteria bacterium]